MQNKQASVTLSPPPKLLTGVCIDTKDYVPLMLAAGLAVAGVGTAQAAEGIPHGYVGYQFNYLPTHHGSQTRVNALYASTPVLPWLDIKAGVNQRDTAAIANSTSAWRQADTTEAELAVQPYFNAGPRTELGGGLSISRVRSTDKYLLENGDRGSIRSYHSAASVEGFARHSFNSRWYGGVSLHRYRDSALQIVKRDNYAVGKFRPTWSTVQNAFVAYRFTPQWGTGFSVTHTHKGPMAYGVGIQYNWK